MTSLQNLRNLEPITAIGRTYYLLLPTDLTDLELENAIFNLEKNLNLKQKVRILIDDSKQFEKVQNLLKKLQDKIQNEKNQKIKIVKNENENDNSIQKLEEKNLEKDQKNQQKNELPFEFDIYKTNFFQVKIDQIENKIEQNPIINWQSWKQNGFEYSEVFFDQNNENIDFQIAMNFFLTSFGSNFGKDLNGKTKLTPDLKAQNDIKELVIKAYQNKKNKIFLVKSKSQPSSNLTFGQNSSNLSNNPLDSKNNQDNAKKNINLELEKLTNEFEFVGAFSFLEIESEVQLHYTAGKTTFPNDYKGKKLPILTAAMLDILANSPNYKQVKKLTFSNKDQIVSKAYESVGFELLPTRQCILVK